MIYKPHIDGLRAVAVVPVMLFHARTDGFAGGFVGVDVFFVISGYLITQLIAGDLERGNFSLLSFYERRARRILPALFVIIVACSILATVYFVPAELTDFGKSVVATVLFYSNFRFWSEVEYFDAPADLKPLLHTWSLAVEEQFYILFPPLLMACHRFLRRRWTLCLVPLLLASFALSVWGVSHRPQAAFFLTPFRMWELLLGALVATGAFPAVHNRRLRETAAALGLALIAFAVVTFSALTPFPGSNALIPCLGTALVIWSGDQGDSVVTKALATPLLVLIGLCSYSLYLWHWPALVFARYILMRELTGGEVALLFIAVSCLSYLTWRYIETPVRRGRAWTGGRVLVGGALAGIACLGFGKAMVTSHGFPERLSANTLAILASVKADTATASQRILQTDCPYLDTIRHSGRFCIRGAPGRQPSFILVGDSHANVLSSGVFEAAERLGLSGYQFTDAGFRPLPGVVEAGNAHRAELTSRFLEFLRQQKSLQLVIFAGYWELQATGRSYRHDGILFRDENYDGSGLAYNRQSFKHGLFRLLKAFPDRKFALLEDVPSGWKLDVNFAARIAHIKGTSFLEDGSFGISRQEYEAQLATYRDILNSATVVGNAFVVPLGDVLCDSKVCRGFRDGKLLYRNGDHLSTAGAKRFVETLSYVFERGLDRTASLNRSQPD